MMAKFWELLEQSIIVQSVITVLVIGVYVYMIASGQPVDETFGDIVMMVLVFWMGSKSGQAQVAKGVQAQIKAALSSKAGE